MQNPQGYGGPPTQQYRPPSPFAHLGKSALGDMDANAAGALAYIGVVGLILVIIEKNNRFVRFHAIQSLLWGVGMSVLMVVLLVAFWIIGLILMMIGAGAATATGNEAGGILAIVVWFVTVLLWLGALIIFPLVILGGLVWGAMKAYQGQMYRLPIVGGLAEKFAK